MLPIRPKTGDERLRVAVVGSGPAAMYTADELLKRPGVEVTVIDRLPTPYGLVRAGVAPDHPETRSVTSLFTAIEGQRGFGYALGLEVGTDVTHQELLDHHHAVVYATGAAHDRALGIAGESTPGSASATEFVAWYNGHPDHADLGPNLATERVVIIGNGNVALDAARILATDPERLATTDIADHALAALRRSSVREVVLLGRRGPAQAAFTLPELVGLLGRDDVEVATEGFELDERTRALRESGDLDLLTDRKLEALESLASRQLAPRCSAHRAALPRRALGHPRRRARHRHSGGAHSSGRGRSTASCGPRRRGSATTWRPDWCSGRSGTAAPVSSASRSTRRRERCRTRQAASSMVAIRGAVGTSRVGSSGARRDSSAPTRRARRKRSTRSSATPTTDCCRPRRVPRRSSPPWCAADVRTSSTWPAGGPSTWQERDRGRAEGRPRARIVDPDEMRQVAASGRRSRSGGPFRTRRMGTTRSPV